MQSNLINNHSSVLVPIETWEFNSPFLKFSDKAADLGLFAEALIYYDRVFVYINTVREFEEFVAFFAKEKKEDLLIELIKSKTINFFYYSFMSTAVNDQGEFSIWNIQSPRGYQSDFIRLVVNRANLPISTKKRRSLWQAIVDNLHDEESIGYDPPVLDAKNAMRDKEKCAQLIQAYTDYLYRKFDLGTAPKVECVITDINSEKWNITTNINFEKLDQIADRKLIFRNEMPIIGEVQSNRLIWTSQKWGYDLFLGDVMSQVVGNKLDQANKSLKKKEDVITELKSKVEFPNVQDSINNEDLTVNEVLKIRAHADKFRKWLQQEGERDRDAIIAYHNEVAKKSGFIKNSARILKLFGNLSGIASAAYPVLTTDTSPASNLVTTGAATVATVFINKVADSIGKEWKPVVFGEWLKTEVDKRKKSK